ncbi:MAG TPA: hypothetical protein VLE97_09835 [Gaiellaceae bacterium]|nr:hypothetical protein [Gaiellaceae bacterium]
MREPVADDDPEYRIAYDVARRKVGCVLIQAALGCTVPSRLFHDFFGMGEAWTVDASGVQVYRIRRSQLPILAAKTSVDREEF